MSTISRSDGKVTKVNLINKSGWFLWKESMRCYENDHNYSTQEDYRDHS